MTLSLRYGSSRLELSVRDEFVARKLDTNSALALTSARKSDAEVLRVAFEELANASFFDSLEGKKLGLLISDATRLELRSAVLEPLFSRLGVAESITTYVCTGTHDPKLPENVALAAQIASLASCCAAKVRVVVHDARDNEFESHGATSRGTPVEIAPSTRECDLFLVVSGLKTHYFALCTLTGSAGIEWAGGGRTQEVTTRGIFVPDSVHASFSGSDAVVAEALLL